jgi:hypothetical protein
MSLNPITEPTPAARAVRPIAERFDLSAQLELYAPLAWRESLDELPTLNLDDVSAIPFLIEIEGIEEYQHRARLRAGDGDLFAAGTPENREYELYCRERLGLGSIEFLHTPSENLLAISTACSAGPILDRLARRATEQDGLVIHPYMGIESVWELARRLAEHSATTIGVLSPPPPVTWIANDKGSFSEIVSRILGPEYLVETRTAANPAALVKDLLELSNRHPQVALKRMRCASAMGNAVFDARDLAATDPSATEQRVLSFLARTEWDGREDVQVVAWEDTDLSPSTQFWIPPLESGAPRLDGIYEQLLEGERRVFIGSRPTTLPDAVNRSLASASTRVAEGLQALGYVGRCSFDLLVIGDPNGDFDLRFTECNGRWGGTSTPMSLLDRLLPGPRPPYRAQDFVHPQLTGATFTEILERTKEHLFDPRTGRGRFIFYNVGPLAKSGKLDVIAWGRAQAEAEAAMENDLPRLLGLS